MFLSSSSREESNLLPVHCNNKMPPTAPFSFSSPSGDVADVFRTSSTTPTGQNKCSLPITGQFRVLFDAIGPHFQSEEEHTTLGPSEAAEDDTSKGDLHRRSLNGIQDGKTEEKKKLWKECGALVPPITPSTIPSPATTTAVVCASPSVSPLLSPVHPVPFFSKPDEVVIPVHQPLSSVTIQDFTQEFMHRLQYKYPELARTAVVSHYLVCQSDEERKEKEGEIDLPVLQSEKRTRGTSLRCGREEMKRLSVPSSPYPSPPTVSTGPSPSFSSLPSSPCIGRYWRIDAKMNQYDTLNEFFWTRPWSLPVSQPHTFRNVVPRENTSDNAVDSLVVLPDAAALGAMQMCTTTTTIYDLIVQWEMPSSSEGFSSVTLSSTNPVQPSSLTHRSSPLGLHGAAERQTKCEGTHDDRVALSSYASLGDRLRLFEAQKARKAMQDLFFSPPKPVIHVTQRSTYLDLLSMRQSRREQAEEKEYKKFLIQREKALEKEKKKLEKHRSSVRHWDEKTEEQKLEMEEGTLCTTEEEVSDAMRHTVHDSKTSLHDRSHRTSLPSSFPSSSSSSLSECMTDKEEVSEVDTPEEGIVLHQSEKHYQQRLRLEAAQRTARQAICQKETQAFDAFRELEAEHCYHVYTLERLTGNALENGVWLQLIQSNRRYPMDTQPTFDDKKVHDDQARCRMQGNESAATSFAFRQLVEKKKSLRHRESSKERDEDVVEEGLHDSTDGEGNVHERTPAGETDATGVPTEPSFRDVMMDMVLAERELQKMEKQTAAICGHPVVHRPCASEEQGEAATGAGSLIPTTTLAASSSTPSSHLLLPPSANDGYHAGGETKNASALEDLMDTKAYQEALEHYLDWRHEILCIERKDFREMVYLMQEVLAQQAVVDRVAVELAYEEEWNAAAPLWDCFSNDTSSSFPTADVELEEKKKDGHAEGEARKKETEDGDACSRSSVASGEEDAQQTRKEEEITWKREENVDREKEGVDALEGMNRKEKMEMEHEEEESDEAFRKRNRDPRFRIVTHAIHQFDAEAGERLQQRLATCREEYRKRVEKERIEKETREKVPTTEG